MKNKKILVMIIFVVVMVISTFIYMINYHFNNLLSSVNAPFNVSNGQFSATTKT